MKKKDRKDEKSITEGFLKGLPIFGNFFKELTKAEVFQERFKEVDEKIKENLKRGSRKRWGISTNISVRPIIDKERKEPIKKDDIKINIGDDYFYEKKGNKLILAVKVPKKSVDLNIKGKYLSITSHNFEKKLKLPNYYKNIKIKQYKKGILVLELTK